MNKISKRFFNLILIIYVLLFLQSCAKNNTINSIPNDPNDNQTLENFNLSDIEIEFLKNNNLSVEDILPYKKYSNFNIKYYFIYEQYRKKNFSHLEAINISIYPNYYNGYEGYYNALFLDTNLALVNKSFKITNNYRPNNLINIETYNNINYIKRTNEQMLLDNETLQNYFQMYIEAANNNINLIIYSGYRTYEKQHDLYYNVNNQNDNYSAKPGFSEHHTGKALDISDSTYGLTLSFEKSSTYKWLKANCYKYGFVLRYPKNKESITKYNFEPWHFRYVGKDIAKYIYFQNITLEEYLLQNVIFK